ncbi:glutaredoxin-related protein 5, mitochondrial [Paroedura picta]|uniref:glutaredoxin-related protein 5, mitochondrial n=1 Tax=Paroedura picta TaxID=143630 RepID=UPI001014D45E
MRSPVTVQQSRQGGGAVGGSFAAALRAKRSFFGAAMNGAFCRLPAALRRLAAPWPLLSAARPLSQAGDGGGSSSSGSQGAAAEVEKLVRAHPVVVFMKGTPAQPQCGFSNAVVQILRLHGVSDYRAYDVLQDHDLRQGIKNYSNWPTIPQVFLNGEFVGGCDILLQMHQSGDLVEELKKLGIRSALLDSEKDQGKK